MEDGVQGNQRMAGWNGNMFFQPPPDREKLPDGPMTVFAAMEVPPALAEGPPPEDDEPVLLECIDADWMREHQNGEWLDEFRAAPLSVLQLTDYALPPFPQGSSPGETAWFQVEFKAAPSEEANGLNFRSLYGGGVPVHIRYIESLPKDWSRNGPPSHLGWLPKVPPTSLRHHMMPQAWTRADWFAAFNKLNGSSGVAVYDVGQGACQALLSEDTHVPRLYVDLGGGVLFNARTFPSAMAGFCTSARPPVILSHWDWDHWSSAPLFPGLLNLKWLAPPVPDRPIQQAFASELLLRGNLTQWDSTWPPSLKAGVVRIEKCTGGTSNDSGLAVTLYSRRFLARNCLLPGDAAYEYVPSAAAEKFSALCMTHHGGKLHSGTYPAPKRGAVSANSSGPRNTYRHPLFPTLKAHTDAGWPVPAQTGFSGQRPCHVFLPWGKQPHFFHGGCHGPGYCTTAIASTAPTCPMVVTYAAATPLAKPKKKKKAGAAATV